jgi:hypothetical protein
MQFKFNETVYFIFNNTIYKGQIVDQESKQNSNIANYRVISSSLGLMVFKGYELHKSIDKLVEAIMYQEPVRASQEFKTWAVS